MRTSQPWLWGAAALWGGEYALLQDCVFRNNSCPDAAGCLSFDAVHRVSIDECDIQVVCTGSNHYNGVYAVNADTIRVTHSRFWSDQAIHGSRNSGLFAKVNVFRGNRLEDLAGEFATVVEILGEAYYDPVGTMIVEDNEIYRSPSSLHSGIHGVLIGGSEVTATISGNTFVRTESGVVSSTGGPLDSHQQRLLPG